MRKVFTPPPVSGGRLWPAVGAVLITLGVFMVLPLTQMISSGLKKKVELTEVKTVVKPPPPVEKPPEPPPPPPQEEQKPPTPELTPAEQNFSLDSLDLDAGMGGGAGSLLGAFNPGDAIAESSKDVKVADVSELDKQPELIASVKPNYPSDMRKAKVEGTVVLVFLLAEDGRVEDPRVESSTRPEFEKPAMDAVRKFKFRPGSRSGEPVRTYMKLPFAFRIQS